MEKTGRFSGSLLLIAVLAGAPSAHAGGLAVLQLGACGQAVPIAVAQDFPAGSCLDGVDPELSRSIRRRAERIAREICYDEPKVRELERLRDDQFDVDYGAWIAGSIMSFGLATITAIPRGPAKDEQYFREAVLFARREAWRAGRRRPGVRHEGPVAAEEARQVLDEIIAYYRDEHRVTSEEYGNVLDGIEEDSSVFHLGHDQESSIKILAWEENAHLALHRDEWGSLMRLYAAPVAGCGEGRDPAEVSARREAAGAPAAGVTAPSAAPRAVPGA